MAYLKSILLLATVLQSVLAHFTLDYPATRGFNEDTEATVPCGHFDTVGNRTQFPLTNGFLEIYSGHTSWSYTVNVVLGDSPVVADFSSNASQIGSGSRSYPEKACLSVDLSKNSAIKDGVNGTLQIVYNGGDGLLYQCTDVTFTSAAAAWNASACANADGSSASASSSTSAAPSTSSTSSAASLTITAALMLVAAVFVSAIII
jgi:hypothetical protein